MGLFDFITKPLAAITRALPPLPPPPPILLQAARTVANVALEATGVRPIVELVAPQTKGFFQQAVGRSVVDVGLEAAGKALGLGGE